MPTTKSQIDLNTKIQNSKQRFDSCLGIDIRNYMENTILKSLLTSLCSREENSCPPLGKGGEGGFSSFTGDEPVM